MKWIKRLFIFALVVVLAGAFWLAFGIWTGIYSVYSVAPSKKLPDGVTLIVSRDPGEPMFNSPDVRIPPPKPRERGSGLTFAPARKPARALEDRTVLELPYISWAYEKSLEPPKKEE